MVDDDERSTSTAANDIEIIERFSIIQQGSEVLGGFSVSITSDRNSTRIITTLLGYNHVQYAVRNITKAQHKVSR